MRTASLIAFVCIALAGANGCHDKPETRADASARVDAAIQIQNPGDRDSALTVACMDAAKSGFGDVVIRGARKVDNPGTRDQVLCDCALKLRDVGQAGDANQAAKLISNPNTRDQVLKKLAGA